MSTRKFQYVMANRDPELVAELQAELRDMFREEMAELRQLRKLAPSPYKVDPRMNNAAEKWLTDATKSESRATTRDARKSEKIRLITNIINVLIKPIHTQEREEIADENSERRAKALALRKAFSGELPEDEHRALAKELGNDFNIPMPEGTRE
jgi:hypothetical protein